MEQISVIIPAYNAANYLRQSIDSALSQTYSAHEIIVIDDGSTDNTPEILHGYGEKLFVMRQANAGVAAACNAGVSAAHGEWISFLDADDIWLSDKLARQIQKCGDHAISHTDSVCFGDNISGEVRRSSFEPLCSGYVLKKLLLRNFITKSTVMMRREVFLKYGGFDSKYMGVEDWPFWLKVCADYELGYLPEVTVRYRVHRKSKSMQGRRTIVDHLRIINETFKQGGVGQSFPELRCQALASSYQINCHYAAESGDWTFALYCTLRALQYEPTNLKTWKNLIKAALIPLGVAY